MGDVKLLEAENRRLREERFLVKQQLLQLQLAVSSAGCTGINTEPLSIEPSTSAASAAAQRSATASLSTDQEMPVSDHPSPNFRASAVKFGDVTSSTSEETRKASTSKPASRILFLGRKSAREAGILDSGGAPGVAGHSSTAQPSSSAEHSPQSSYPTSFDRNSMGHSFHSRELDDLERVQAQVSTSLSDTKPLDAESLNKETEVQQIALDKLFRGRTGSLGTKGDIDSLPLLAARLQNTMAGANFMKDGAKMEEQEPEASISKLS